MLKTLRRAGTIAGLAGIAAWILRLMAHSKQPPAEGRWRELRIEEN